MRVLQVHTRYRQRGGEDSVVAEESRLLRSAGHEVALVEFSNPSSPIEAARVLARAPWNRSAAAQAVKAARDFGADVVHVHNTWFGLSPAVFSVLSDAGFPTVATIHNYRFTCANAMLYRDNGICMDCVGRGPWNGVRYACYRGSRLQSIAVAVTISTQRRWVWPTNVDVVVALTDFAADLLKLSGVPPERVMVKPNTVEDPGPRAKAPSASRLLVYAGRLTEEKGIVDLIDAWSDADRQDLKLVVAGDGPLAAQVKARPSEGIEFLGWSDPEVVADLMSQARAVILPSRWFEGLPMVVIEAAARGTPVVVPDHGALAQVVGAGGWSYPSQDRAALSDLLSRLHREDVDTRGELARRNFEDHFSPDRGLESLESIYAAAQARSGLKT